jgi:uncharacterized protein (DUF952 family)
MTLIYKICPAALWAEAERAGVFTGMPIDTKDGYIHFSTGAQTPETAAIHFKGQDGLLLIAVEGDRFGDKLKWEVSRGGALFPHLYATLPVSAALWVKPMPLGPDGKHRIPDLTG